MEPETRYAKTRDGVHIAYQARGHGPIDLVYIHGFAANFEVELELPENAAFSERLGSFSRLIYFDKRGTGLSDRFPTGTNRGYVDPDAPENSKLPSSSCSRTGTRQ